MIPQLRKVCLQQMRRALLAKVRGERVLQSVKRNVHTNIFIDMEIQESVEPV